METFLILVFVIVAFIAYQTMRGGGRQGRRRWRFDVGRQAAEEQRGALPPDPQTNKAPGGAHSEDAPAPD